MMKSLAFLTTVSALKGPVPAPPLARAMQSNAPGCNDPELTDQAKCQAVIGCAWFEYQKGADGRTLKENECKASAAPGKASAAKGTGKLMVAPPQDNNCGAENLQPPVAAAGIAQICVCKTHDKACKGDFSDLKCAVPPGSPAGLCSCRGKFCSPGEKCENDQCVLPKCQSPRVNAMCQCGKHTCGEGQKCEGSDDETKQCVNFNCGKFDAANCPAKQQKKWVTGIMDLSNLAFCAKETCTPQECCEAPFDMNVAKGPESEPAKGPESEPAKGPESESAKGAEGPLR